MRTVTYKLEDLKTKVIHIGKVAENDATRVQIDAGSVFAEHPAAVPTMSMINPDGTAFPVSVERSGDLVLWDVKDSALAAEGPGEIQFTFTEGNTVVKGPVGRVQICRSIVGDGEAPDPIQDWMTEADAALDEIEGISATAETLSAGSQATASYADGVLSFGIPQGAQGAPGQDGQDGADGQDGVSPTVAVTTITGGHTVTITDAQGDHAFNVMDGTAGAVIDDTAGAGDTDKTWSADKLTSDVLSALQQIEDELVQEIQTPIQLYADKGWNAFGKSVGDSFNPENPIDNTGTYCAGVTVSKGDRFKINANSGEYAFRSYVVINASYKITRITTAAFDGEITISDGETKLFVTMQNYNSSSNGLWKITEETITESVSALKEEVDDFADRNFASVVPTTETVVSGKGYNMGSANVGDTYTSTTSDNENAACQVISVEPNTKYFIYGVGNLYSYCLYAVLDVNNKILEIEKTNTNYRDTPKVVTPSADAAKIIVNYWTYNYLTDKTTKQKINTLDFLFTSTEEPLKGKTILLLGDSILANDRFNGVAEYLKQKTGATIINGAVGGSRICGTTRGESPFTPFDGENLVTAITTGVWTSQEASKSGTGVPSYVADETLPALEAMDLDDVDIVIFNWMTNDYRGNTSKATYQTAFDNVVSMLLTENPKLRLLCSTLQWFDTNDGGSDETELYTMGTGFDAADCTIESAEKNHIPVIDMYRGSPVSALTKTVYMDSDYLHPNTEGNRVYADLLVGKLKSMF